MFWERGFESGVFCFFWFVLCRLFVGIFYCWGWMWCCLWEDCFKFLVFGYWNLVVVGMCWIVYFCCYWCFLCIWWLVCVVCLDWGYGLCKLFWGCSNWFSCLCWLVLVVIFVCVCWVGLELVGSGDFLFVLLKICLVVWGFGCEKVYWMIVMLCYCLVCCFVIVRLELLLGGFEFGLLVCLGCVVVLR